MINYLRHPLREQLLPKLVLGLDLFLWLCRLPVVLRIHTVRMLLETVARGRRRGGEMPMELSDVVGLVTQLCNLRPFRSRFFPKLCLRQSLALYRTLTQMGYPVEIHFGVRKDDKTLSGHSWVTMEGKPVADTTYSGIFKAVYSHTSIGASEATKERSISNCIQTRRQR
jgi:hypothetical protein